MEARSGFKTLIYGTAAGIDPHQINRTKLPSWYTAGPCYRSTPCQFSSFPPRSALRAVGQSSRAPLQLPPAYLTSSLLLSPLLASTSPVPCSDQISNRLMIMTTLLKHHRGDRAKNMLVLNQSATSLEIPVEIMMLLPTVCHVKAGWRIRSQESDCLEEMETN